LLSSDELFDYSPITIASHLILVLAPHRKRVQEHQILTVPRRDVLLNMQFAVKILLVLGVGINVDLELGELQSANPKKRAEDLPRVWSHFVQVELMAPLSDRAKPPGIQNRRSAIPPKSFSVG